MPEYCFVREDLFYIIDLDGDHQVAGNAECNPGTLRVEKLTAAGLVVVWEAPAVH